MFHVDYLIVIIQEDLGLHKDLSRIPLQRQHTVKQDRGLRGSMVVSLHNEVDSLQSCKVVSLCSETTVIPCVDKFIAELTRAKRASGAPWVRKWSNLPIRENLVIT